MNQGTFTNYVYKILASFDHLPPCVYIFYGMKVYKKWTILDHLPTSSFKHSPVWFFEKYQNPTLKVNFLCQKLSKSFQKNFSLKNIYPFRSPTFVKTFFDKYNFKNNLFLKSCTNFDEHSSTEFKKKSFKYFDSLPKILLFRTHHLLNPTT